MHILVPKVSRYYIRDGTGMSRSIRPRPVVWLNRHCFFPFTMPQSVYKAVDSIQSSRSLFIRLTSIITCRLKTDCFGQEYINLKAYEVQRNKVHTNVNVNIWPNGAMAGTALWI